MINFKKEMKSVNNKNLAAQITSFTEEAMLHSGVNWSDDSERTLLSDIVEEFMNDIAANDGLIEQYKIVFDRRNNTTANALKGTYKFDIHYRQKNCFNVTKILYTINTGPNADLSLIPDFII